MKPTASETADYKAFNTANYTANYAVNYNAQFVDLELSWDESMLTEGETLEDPKVESSYDALVRSLNDHGKVDIEYMSQITGRSATDVISELGDAIYQNPSTWDGYLEKGWETADEYLSGNLVRKWRIAKKADSEQGGYFARNVKALESILPHALNNKEIYISLGSPWVPTEVIDDFIAHLYRDYAGRRMPITREKLATKHDVFTGTWEIPHKVRFRHSIVDIETFGTRRMEALRILEKTLNTKAIVVYDETETADGSKKRFINQEETILAQEKQAKLIKEFQDWVWEDPERKNLLWRIYEARYGLVKQREYNGSFLELPNLNPAISLYPRQKNSVARILFTPNTLLAHEVGAGKTYIMIVSGMELKRIGLSKKNMYVVPNNIVTQWKDIFLELYPNANILVVTPNEFKPAKRQETLRKMRDGDYDGIIIAYSSFEQIQLSERELIASLLKTKSEIELMLDDKKKGTRKLSDELDKIKVKIKDLRTAKQSGKKEIYFDELGVTRLFIDEAHNYKNLPLDTKNNLVLGINAKGSKKCQAMWDKVRCVQSAGGGVVMATGTPITNSVTDAFVMQKYLQYEELRLLDLQHFDSWVGMFAEQSTEFEVDVDTSCYRMATRLSKFHNMPELSALLGQVADFYIGDGSADIPDFDGYTDVLIPKTESFKTFLKTISDRAERVRERKVKRKEDNMLLITTDGRRGALDLRLTNPKASFEKQSKVFECARNVFKIYMDTREKRLTQLVFCDISTPRQGFNLYDELKRLLVNYGVPASEIAFVHDAGTERKKEELFEKVRKGDIRILIGSTFKLGLGVNIQDKLIALHHLDVPWRPADMVQREGRILRQGNTNEKVQIYRYITEGSFDAYSWQLLETKQRFISELLSGSYKKRSGKDIGDTILNYAEVKALAIGNPLVKKRVELSNELSRLISLRRKSIESKEMLNVELSELPAQVEKTKWRIARAKEDQEYYKELQKTIFKPVTTIEKELETKKRRDIREKIFLAVNSNNFMPEERYLMDYLGFKINLPPNMNPKKPYVWLERCGRYYVELGDSEKGCLIRIDNFLENFERHIEKLDDSLERLYIRENAIRKELEEKDDIPEEISKLREGLDAIDSKLGVTFNE